MSLSTKTILVIGGTSGFGRHLATAFLRSNKVIVTGRTNPGENSLEFRSLELVGDELLKKLDAFVSGLPNIDILIYAAGSYERGLISEAGDGQIINMSTIYLLAPMLLIPRILIKQKTLSGIIAVSSISEWRPNRVEPVYCSFKAGFGMFCRCLSLDPGIHKTLVVAPARINKGKSGAIEGQFGKLDPLWVAETVMQEYEDSFRYKLIRISRDPAKVETEKEAT